MDYNEMCTAQAEQYNSPAQKGNRRMRHKSDLKMYSHERVLYQTHVTLNDISDKWDMFKIDILEQVVNSLEAFETFEDFKAAIERIIV